MSTLKLNMSAANWSNTHVYCNMNILHDCRILFIIIISYICNGVTGIPTMNPTIKPTANYVDTDDQIPFYEDVNTLKYIAIGGLLMVISCCLTLILCVRHQINKTEQGTEIEKYVKKTQPKIPNIISQNVNENQVLQTNVITADGNDNENKNEVAKEIYLIKIAQQNEMGEKFRKMEKESMHDEQADEDEDFGHTLSEAVHIQTEQQNEIFSEMAFEQQKHK
eukprot:95115_1